MLAYFERLSCHAQTVSSSYQELRTLVLCIHLRTCGILPSVGATEQRSFVQESYNKHSTMFLDCGGRVVKMSEKKFFFFVEGVMRRNAVAPSSLLKACGWNLTKNGIEELKMVYNKVCCGFFFFCLNSLILSILVG